MLKPETKLSKLIIYQFFKKMRDDWYNTYWALTRNVVFWAIHIDMWINGYSPIIGKNTKRHWLVKGRFQRLSQNEHFNFKINLDTQSRPSLWDVLNFFIVAIRSSGVTGANVKVVLFGFTTFSSFKRGFSVTGISLHSFSPKCKNADSLGLQLSLSQEL